MKRLRVDLDLLLESFTLDKEGVCKEYLDTITGEVINIPDEVASVFENGKGAELLGDWQKELLAEAELVYNDDIFRYLCIPTLDNNYVYEVMTGFTENALEESGLRKRLLNTLRSNQPVDAFRHELYNNPELLDYWHEYEEEKIKEYIIKWLSELGFEVQGS